MSHFVDMAQFAALSMASGGLPDASDQASASTYERLLRLASEVTGLDADRVESFRAELAEKVDRWRQAEQALLLNEPISPARVARIADSLRDALSAETRLAGLIPNMKKVSSSAEKDRPLLGMNLRVPRDFLVDKVFNNTYADPSDLGRMIAQGFQSAEDARIVEVLRQVASRRSLASGARVIDAIRGLRSRAKHFVFLTPYGGLLDIDEWRSRELADALALVRRVETSALETEAILFDPRGSIRSVRSPEEKEGLEPVDTTMISLGAFDDVVSEQDPQVRVEAGEYFVLWPGPRPDVEVFTDPSSSSVE